MRRRQACGERYALEPTLASAHNNLGNILLSRDRLDEAEICFAHALTLDPQLADAHCNLGAILMDQNRVQEAIAYFRRALSLDPQATEAYQNISLLKSFRPGDEDLAALERVATAMDHLSAGKRVCIHFALGKAYNDVGLYANAFEQWRKGNSLKRDQVRYDEVETHRSLRRIEDAFDASLFSRFEGMGDQSSSPIFILGMPRSGSTLVEQILSSHPQVHGAGELRI